MGQRFFPAEDLQFEGAMEESPDRDDELVINDRVLDALREKLIFDAAASKYGMVDDFNLNTLRGLTLDQALIQFPKLLAVMDDVLVKVSSVVAGSLESGNPQRDAVDRGHEFALHLKKFGRWFYRNGHQDHALKAFEGALQFLGDDGEIYAMMGDIYSVRGNFRDAIACYQQAHIFFPEHKGIVRKLADLHVKKAEMFFASSCLDDAVRCFNGALEYVENYLPALCGLAEIAFIRNEYEDARIYFEHALDVDASSVRALSGLATVHAVSGNNDEAEDLFNEALLKNPAYIPALFDAARFNLRQRKNLPRAMNYVERAVQLDPKNVSVLLLRVEVAMEMKDFDLAEESVEMVLALQPTNKEAFDYYRRLKNGDCFLPENYMSSFRSVSDDRQTRSRDYYFSLRYRLHPKDETLFEEYVVEVAKDSGDMFNRLHSQQDRKVILN